MFLKVLSIISLLLGAPLSHQMASPWMKSKEKQKLIQSAILSTQADSGMVTLLKAKSMSRHILKAAHCFEIDPIIYAALIWRESTFKQNSKSPTGAVGLSQLTKPGIQEVIDRVSVGSKRKNKMLLSQMATCYPQVLKSMPRDPRKADLQVWKNRISQSSELSIIFGAALFRTYFKGNYQKALERYNGEPQMKHRFASDVIALSVWISSSLRVIPEAALENSKFLASIRDF